MSRIENTSLPLLQTEHLAVVDVGLDRKPPMSFKATTEPPMLFKATTLPIPNPSSLFPFPS